MAVENVGSQLESPHPVLPVDELVGIAVAGVRDAGGRWWLGPEEREMAEEEEGEEGETDESDDESDEGEGGDEVGELAAAPAGAAAGAVVTATVPPPLPAARQETV